MCFACYACIAGVKTCALCRFCLFDCGHFCLHLSMGIDVAAYEIGRGALAVMFDKSHRTKHLFSLTANMEHPLDAACRKTNACFDLCFLPEAPAKGFSQCPTTKFIYITSPTSPSSSTQVIYITSPFINIIYINLIYIIIIYINIIYIINIIFQELIRMRKTPAKNSDKKLLQHYH